MKRIEWFDTGLFPTYFGFTTDPKAFAAELKKLGVSQCIDWVSHGADATTHTLERPSGNPRHIIIVTLDAKRNKSIVDVAGLLAHEAVHVWQNILTIMGESVRREDEMTEIEAYAIQHFTCCMLRAYMRRKKK